MDRPVEKNRFCPTRDLIALEGNKPLLLDDPDSVWVIQAGRVDVFAVPVKNGQPAGKLSHLFRAEAGMSLFGVKPAAPQEIGLLVYGSPGTQLHKMGQLDLWEMAQQKEQCQLVAAWLEQWVLGFSAAVCRELPPKEFEPVRIGSDNITPAYRAFRPVNDVIWVKPVEGQIRFLGQENLPPLEMGCFFPLTKSAWLNSTSDSQLEAAETTTLLEDKTVLAALNQFHCLALASAAEYLHKLEIAERQRFQIKAERDQKFVINALTNLAEVVDESSEKKETVRRPADDPLLKTCQLIGEILGIKFVAPPLSGQGPSRDPLADLVKASRIRQRQVVLKGEWWFQDSGPLLAYREEDDRPVALLPLKSTGYELHDPVNQVVMRVTPKVAATLKPFAYTFYRSLPARAISAIDLLKFSLNQDMKRDFIMLALMGIAGGIFGMLIPVATGLLFDTIIPEAERGQLAFMTSFLLTGAVAAFLFQITRSVALVRLQGKMDAILQAAIWDRLLTLPIPFFRNYSTGDLAVRAMGINAIRQVFSGVVVTTILTGFFSLFNFGLLFIYDVQLAIIATGLVLVSLAIIILLNTWQIRHLRFLMELEGKISGLVLQIINGIAKFRVAGAENRAFFLWSQEFSRQKRVAIKARTISNYLAVFNSALPIITAMILFTAVISYSNLSTGNFLAFNAAFNGLLSAMIAVSAIGSMILCVVPLYERARPILETMPEVNEAKTHPNELTGAIEVSHVNFRYSDDGPPILQDVSFQINPGELVALVGPSGSGKSTLFRLLLGFETPSSGSIYYNGQDLAGLDVQAVRYQLGVVLQDGQIMSGDIFSNIIGSSRLTLDDAWEAARLAGLDQDIKQMPMEMHTFLTDGAATLSGGQRQRLLIARAIVKKPRIIYFDEATSALDNQTQTTVSRSLESFQTTRVVIAHRLSTIINADRIYVLDKGRVVQSGTYQELINQEGLFAELAKRQIA